MTINSLQEENQHLKACEPAGALFPPPLLCLLDEVSWYHQSNALFNMSLSFITPAVDKSILFLLG